MTFGKASALAIAFVAAIGLGIWISPEVRNAAQTAPSTSTGVVQGSGMPKDGQAVATARANKPAARPAARLVTFAASEEKVQDHVKPLLNRGANVTKASDGFRNAEQFVTVAHAARNTEIPFILLKHRVLTEGKSLTTAIRESKPALDATIEANRARAEAKADMAKLRG